MNAPTSWQSNSMQDAALFIVMNLAAMKSSRETILELHGVDVLTRITEYNKHIRREAEATDEQKQLDFQRLKAVSVLVWSVVVAAAKVVVLTLHNAPLWTAANGSGVSHWLGRAFWSATTTSVVQWLL